jgi:hypothetical protein
MCALCPLAHPNSRALARFGVRKRSYNTKFPHQSMFQGFVKCQLSSNLHLNLLYGATRMQNVECRMHSKTRESYKKVSTQFPMRLLLTTHYLLLTPNLSPLTPNPKIKKRCPCFAAQASQVKCYFLLGEGPESLDSFHLAYLARIKSISIIYV